MKIFRAAFPKKKFRHEYEQLRTLISALGEVRDLDVFIDKLEKYRAGTQPADVKALDLMIAHQKALRIQRRRSLTQTINSLNRVNYKKNFELFTETAL